MENFRITKVTFLHDVCRSASTFSYRPYINMGMCFCLLYLIKISKMAAERYKGVHAGVQAFRVDQKTQRLFESAA